MCRSARRRREYSDPVRYVVSGVSRGIGAEVANSLLTAGHQVCGVVRRSPALRSYAASLRLEQPQIRVSSIYPGRVATDTQVEVITDLSLRPRHPPSTR
jgi:NAD(P)-dependent dehydrogenase (short-subunit alcohol dehydrogenase family)